MNRSPRSTGIKQICHSALPSGGFALRKGGTFRPDATAWAVIALTALGAETDLRELACQRLAARQLADGRVSISPEHPESFWPTPLAILAWQDTPACKEAQDRAVSFLLATSGLLLKKDPEAIFGHNPELKGWPWRSETSCWSEPTAMAMMALQVAGYDCHLRVVEATRMLMDRQIPDGGWNYGNTTVFGQVLHPMPESTGMVLTALEHKVSRKAVQKSIAFLEDRVADLKTPWSLGWTLLGLGAWGSRPASAEDLIEVCLARQEKVGGYDTSSLAVLLVAAKATGGLVSLYQAGTV